MSGDGSEALKVRLAEERAWNRCAAWLEMRADELHGRQT